jgi:peptidoglycan/xylan/chitin deacetylase (PgdA/CDA1 family)
MKIVQCWDDGINDDIKLIEVLRKYNAKASFNLNPGLHSESRQGGHNPKWNKVIERLAISELKDVYEGYTIANHSMTHPRATKIDLDTWRTEVVDARKILQDWFQQPILGFVYPYGDYDAKTAEIVKEAGHIYARTTKNQTPCSPPSDPLQFHSDCHFNNEKFWDLYQKAKDSECGVFYFWGHSYELVTDADWQAFEAKIARITQDPETEWADLPDLFKA